MLHKVINVLFFLRLTTLLKKISNLISSMKGFNQTFIYNAPVQL
jgi:hypothetical protein